MTKFRIKVSDTVTWAREAVLEIEADHLEQAKERALERAMQGTDVEWEEYEIGETRYEAELAWDGPTNNEGEPLCFRNLYKCGACGHAWEDDYSCAVDDDRPACGARHWTPYKTVDIDEHGEVILAEDAC